MSPPLSADAIHTPSCDHDSPPPWFRVGIRAVDRDAVYSRTLAFHMKATQVVTDLRNYFPHALIWIETDTGAILETFAPATD